MDSVNLLILLLFVPFTNTNPLPTVSPDTANAYLRSFLPWWPNNTDFSLRTAPTPVEVRDSKNGSLVDNSTAAYENQTVLAENEDEIDPSTLRVQSLPASPLDEFSPESAPKSFISESMNHHDGNFIISFDEMGECPRDCSNDLREALGIVLQDMSHVERYQRICEKYSNASICVNEDARCDKDDRGMFEMMTSGLHYMCVEQELAFNATIKCIDDEAGIVQSECDAQCQTKNLFMNWMMRTAFQDTIQQGVHGIVGAATGTNANPLAFLQGAEGAAGASAAGWADMLANVGQRPPNPQDAQQGFENFRQFTNDLCRIGDCMLDCIRSKFNTRCEGSAGTLLSEVFVRPIAASQNKLSILRPVLGSFMPEQCNYLTNNADLKKHRIDSTMDEELKRMYTEKVAKEIRDRTAQDELLSNLVPLDDNGVPLPRALPELQPVDSPLDVSVKTLDQLILDMYSKNETEALNISEKNNVTTTFFDSEENESTSNSTLETTDSPVAANATYVETTTMSIVNPEEESREADVDGSGAESTSESFEQASGNSIAIGDDSESSGNSYGNETSGNLMEESGEILLTTDTNEGSGEASSGEDSSSGSSLEEAFGSGSLSQTSESSTESSGEGSGVDESSGSSGESSGAYESSGDDVISSTTVQDLY